MQINDIWDQLTGINVVCSVAAHVIGNHTERNLKPIRNRRKYRFVRMFAKQSCQTKSESIRKRRDEKKNYTSDKNLKRLLMSLRWYATLLSHRNVNNDTKPIYDKTLFWGHP